MKETPTPFTVRIGSTTVSMEATAPAVPSLDISEGSLVLALGGEGRVDWYRGTFTPKEAAVFPPQERVASSLMTKPKFNAVTATERSFLDEIVKFASFDQTHLKEAGRLAEVFKRRFPGAENARRVENALREGLEQGEHKRRLSELLVEHGPWHEEALSCKSELLNRWPFLSGKIERDFQRALHHHTSKKIWQGYRPSITLKSEQDHRVTALPAAPEYTVLIDETGGNFEEGLCGDGKFVAVVVPAGTTLPDSALHAVDAPPSEADKVMQELLDSNAAVLGIRMSDLHSKTGDRWYDGVLELLHWITRLVPFDESAPSLRLQVIVEARGQARAGQSWKEAAHVLSRYVQAWDPIRAQALAIEIEVRDDHPWMAYADVVAHAWAARSRPASLRLKASELEGACLPSEETASVREAWDSALKGRPLDERHWNNLLLHGNAKDHRSLAGHLLELAGAEAVDETAIWDVYLERLNRHLDSKSVNMRLVGAQADWLERWKPHDKNLPHSLSALWQCVQLIRDNHLGYGSAQASPKSALNQNVDGLIDEDARFVCRVDLHRAVTYTNRYEFAQAAAVLEGWYQEAPRVMGLQLWGRLQSSRGQHRAFTGDLRGAVEDFNRALEAFDRLSDPSVGKGESLQTGTYKAIAMMDDSSVSNADARSAVEAVVGPIPAAIARLASASGPADRYSLHLLLRWLVHRTPPEGAHYVNTARSWQVGSGHPWPLIECYRALLLEAACQVSAAEVRLESACRLAWADEQGPVVRLIGAVIAAILESREKGVPGDLDMELTGIEWTIPNARDRVEMIRRWRQDPTNDLQLLRDVLPFNFR
jgi:hypothetical protein